MRQCVSFMTQILHVHPHPQTWLVFKEIKHQRLTVTHTHTHTHMIIRVTERSLVPDLSSADPVQQQTLFLCPHVFLSLSLLFFVSLSLIWESQSWLFSSVRVRSVTCWLSINTSYNLLFPYYCNGCRDLGLQTEDVFTLDEPLHLQVWSNQSHHCFLCKN